MGLGFLSVVFVQFGNDISLKKFCFNSFCNDFSLTSFNSGSVRKRRNIGDHQFQLISETTPHCRAFASAHFGNHVTCDENGRALSKRPGKRTCEFIYTIYKIRKMSNRRFSEDYYTSRNVCTVAWGQYRFDKGVWHSYFSHPRWISIACYLFLSSSLFCDKAVLQSPVPFWGHMCLFSRLALHSMKRFLYVWAFGMIFPRVDVCLVLVLCLPGACLLLTRHELLLRLIPLSSR